ncbi:DNA-binding transcriptional regulator NtrC [Rhodovastum atsumiense]|uniref:Sigma-54-dependent Fis family transcriptional regulator n=1 Tax=Rhodovastum atsumiense TaxID=504468 RepID=A0A5M6J283_9PROT|nr:sigma-54 dependent transcriptional regulator [Rhodovastum atsumiense]KAA5614710.1 sigma-54-dependent Fis family transcriptional regulator [Rhodovastum atsumiense]CAH2599754.1 DNA-binding transcriptional regulator NtrC [Rhodovastum atsumiense]
MSRILIIDDDDALRESIAETLGDLGHEPEQAADGMAGLDRIRAGGIDAVLLDLRMPGLDGIEVLRRIRALPAPPAVAVLTAVPTAANTIEAMRLGAVDHLAKPVGRADLAGLVARMLPPPAPARPAPPPAEADELVGSSAPMREVQKAIGRLADSEATVLITGETGTGKEVVARAIHRHGRRSGRAFVALNCAAIPATLLESQLFGHARGAFTGATADRAGSFRDADGGTLFLDEIGDMDLAMQAKLLRVLQDRVVVPVGGRPVPVDVRILAATHRDLRTMVAKGSFREDLFYRIGVVPVQLPPLRERLSDILPLAEHFLALAGSAKRLSAEAAARLLAYPWPGNVRELRNAIERAAVLAPLPVLTAADFGFLDGTEAAAPDWLAGDLPGAVARLEAEMIRRALASCGGNRAEAARRLGIHRQLLYEKMRRLGLDPSGIRTDGVGTPDGTPAETEEKYR